MLALGLLSILQVTWIPGYLCLKLAGFSSRSTIQTWVYSFAVSLIINYSLVYTLATLEFYNVISVYGFIGLELCVGLWLLKRRNFRLRSRLDLSEISRVCFESFGLEHLAGWLALALAAASFFSFGHLFYRNFGSVFALWDDAVSWDRWAEQWVANRFPSEVGYYPQLVPANWSLTYVIIRSTDVKMFAKAVMPLFPIATFLLFLDMAFRRKCPQYLISLAIYGALLYTFLGESLIVSGYMETALPFFGFLTVYALLELSEDQPTVGTVLLASLFAGATGLVKQGGLYMVPLCGVWTCVVLYRRGAVLAKDGQLRGLVQASLVGVILVLPWYIRQYLNISAGNEVSNVSYLSSLAAQGKGPLDVLAAAFMKVYNARAGFARPFCWFLAGTIVLSVADTTARKVLLWALVPILLLWAMFFSYEVRTASLAFPFGAFCSAAGAGVLLRSIGLLSKRSSDPAKAANTRKFLLGAVCVLAISVSLYSTGIRDTISRGWQRDMMGDVANWWAIPLGMSAVLVLAVGLLAGRRWAITINWYYVSAATAWLWLSTTMDRAPDILQRQIELQKNIDEAGLNRKLYDFMTAEGIHGNVATDYWVLGRLPQLKTHYVSRFFPDNTSVEWLEKAAEMPGVCYILIAESELSAPAKEALARGLYRTVLIEGNRRFIKTCPDSGGSK